VGSATTVALTMPFMVEGVQNPLVALIEKISPVTNDPVGTVNVKGLPVTI